MKKTKSIRIPVCMTIAVLAGTVFLGAALKVAQNQGSSLKPETELFPEQNSMAEPPLAETEIPSAESMAVYTTGAYVLGIQDEKLVVFQGDGSTVFFETGIRSSDLSQELQNRIAAGLSFSSEEELYEFLENCSS